MICCFLQSNGDYGVTREPESKKCRWCSVCGR